MAPNYCPNCGHDLKQYKDTVQQEEGEQVVEDQEEKNIEDIDMSKEQLKAMKEVAEMDRDFIEELNDELRRNILLDVKDIIEGKDTERRFF
jgi:uncharacterized Zn finger protein (UPF0148 family)